MCEWNHVILDRLARCRLKLNPLLCAYPVQAEIRLYSHRHSKFNVTTRGQYSVCNHRYERVLPWTHVEKKQSYPCDLRCKIIQMHCWKAVGVSQSSVWIWRCVLRCQPQHSVFSSRDPACRVFRLLKYVLLCLQGSNSRSTECGLWTLWVREIVLKKHLTLHFNCSVV
jgi:hypothetical protein